MENAIGIEAARARLGDIADHARTTGQVTALTRHGRTIAVIGPAHTVQPAGSVKVTLWLGDEDQVRTLPGLPRVGETFLVETSEGDEVNWLVTNVQWDLRPDEEPRINVLCDEAEEYSNWLHSNRPTANES
jgi:antitoxin (DNA-binding transcriptional repressor) of toxin-antitoxin stability system